MARTDLSLKRVIGTAVAELERAEEIVICSASPERAVKHLCDAVRTVTPDTGLDPAELYGVRALILHAVTNASFFDAEMPTLTGFTADEFMVIAAKLPRE